ncbi:MAG TPA: peptidoglycan bridge formation glycyltransferase FemA/FemB family protein [Candidatus Limnocylindria bacterium]|nr:peptidoglycan bridge formation glycyltransferase FemA/FemB family protein [Candidatus Limnocylindria bacterium]
MLHQIQESQKDQYNQFIAANSSGSFLQSYEWGQWQKSLGREVFRFFIKDNIGNIAAALQLIKMPLPFGRYYIYAPYGPAIEDNHEIHITDYVKALKEKFPYAVFIRIEPKEEFVILDPKSLVKSSNIQPAKTLLIDLEKSEEQLLANMHNKTRYNIKVAQKHGVEVKEELEISVGHGLYFKEAINLICDTAKRQGFTTYSFNYYENLIDFFILNQESQVKTHLYKAIYSAGGGSSSGGQNQLLATALMVDFGKTRTFLFGGSGQFHKNVMAPYLMHWQAMLDAKAAGYKIYDFWGIETSSGETPGFVRFKLGFGGQEKNYAGAYDAVLNKFFYKTYSLLRNINKIFRNNF